MVGDLIFYSWLQMRFTVTIFVKLKKVRKHLREKYIPWKNWNNFCGLRKFWNKLQKEVSPKISTDKRYNKFHEKYFGEILKFWSKVTKCKNGNNFIPGFFDGKYLKVDVTSCRMTYSPISTIFVTLYVMYVLRCLTFCSFSLNCLATSSFSRFPKSDCTADANSEYFGACLKYLVMVDILTSCYSSVVSFDFDHFRQAWRFEHKIQKKKNA